MCLSDDEYDSDQPDSDVEALLYSKLHYAEDIDGDTGRSLRGVESDELVVEVSSRCSGEGVNGCQSGCEKVVVGRDGCISLSSEESGESDDVVVLSSDDDDLVLLGDDDRDISLNMNGLRRFPVQPGTSQNDLWQVDDKDRYHGIQGFRYHNRGSFHCKSCGKMGHLSKSCRKPKEKVCFLCSEAGHHGYMCPSRMCVRCFRIGHVAVECDQPYVETCDVCNMSGHPTRFCPDYWRRYHLTTEEGPIIKPTPRDKARCGPYCYNCAREGHYGHRCPMGRRGYSTTPFVVSYAIPRLGEKGEDSPQQGSWRNEKGLRQRSKKKQRKTQAPQNEHTASKRKGKKRRANDQGDRERHKRAKICHKPMADRSGVPLSATEKLRRKKRKNRKNKQRKQRVKAERMAAYGATS